MNTIEGMLSANTVRVALVAARFNDLIVGRLIEGALDCYTRHGGNPDSLTVARVPGAWEIPLVCQRLAASGRFDAVIALGAVIRGDTPHFDYVAAEVSKGVAAVAMQTGVPVIFGVLTTDSLDQALERAGVKAGNKGWEAMLAAIEMVDLLPKLD